MFNLMALIKLINTNNDSTIQRQEMSDFMQSQDSNKPSIFTEIFNSIKSDVSIEQFKYRIQGVVQQEYQKVNYEFDLSFKQEEVAQKYEQIKSEMQIQSEFFSYLGYRFKSDDEFNAAFSELLSKYRDSGDESWEKIKNGLMERCASTTPADWMARLNTGRFYTSGTDFQNIVFDDVDLSKYSEAFKHITFNENTFAKVSPEHLPLGFNPQEVLEKGKTIGLGIDKAHANGYTGEGVSYAIIDSGTKDGKFNEGEQHNDIHFAEYNVSQYSENIEWLNHFHGRAVSYIAQEIVPQADCYYYATHFGDGMDASVIDNLKQILEKNKALPDNQKIRFISMSLPLYGGAEAKEVIKELESQGVWVFYGGCEEREGDINKEPGNGWKIAYLEKKDPNGHVDDFDNYQIYAGDANVLYVNAGNRTVPDLASPNEYRHDSIPSGSWSTPVIAGYYVLACQADSTMTKERFLELANNTAQVKESTKPNWKHTENGDWIQQGRTEETVPIKIIDINALLQAIENEKSRRVE